MLLFREVAFSQNSMVVIPLSISQTWNDRKTVINEPIIIASVRQRTNRNRLIMLSSDSADRSTLSVTVKVMNQQLSIEYTTSKKKYLWFSNPTQFMIHGQW